MPPSDFEELTFFGTPGAKFSDLAGAASDDVLMALAAALRVVGRAKTVSRGFDLFEDETVVVERAQSDDVVFIQRFKRRPLRKKAVFSKIVEAGRRFSDRRIARRSRFTQHAVRSGLLLFDACTIFAR